MPERKRLVAGTRWCAHFVAVVVAPVQRRTRNEKMAPENRGHKLGQECLKVNAAGGRSAAAALESSRLGKQPWKAALESSLGKQPWKAALESSLGKQPWKAAALGIRGRNREGRRCVSRCGRAPSAGDRRRPSSD